jgi:hypothetical protein
MTMFKFYLDTDALNRLSGLNGKKLEEFKMRFNSIDAELIVTHVQVDERYSPKDGQKYQEEVDKAIETLRSKGIQIKVENTKITIAGISRCGYSSLSSLDIEKIYDALDKEINVCEKANKNPKDPLNVKRDAIIAVSSVGYSFLITTDKCLCDSFNRVIEEKKELVEKVTTPKAKLATQSSEAVADRILESFSNK